MHAATGLLAHLSIPLAEELLHGFDPRAVVATIVTAMLVAACVLALRVKSRREAWLIVAVLGTGRCRSFFTSAPC